jgi:hypothetical protein
MFACGPGGTAGAAGVAADSPRRRRCASAFGATAPTSSTATVNIHPARFMATLLCPSVP